VQCNNSHRYCCKPAAGQVLVRQQSWSTTSPANGVLACELGQARHQLAISLVEAR